MVVQGFWPLMRAEGPPKRGLRSERGAKGPKNSLPQTLDLMAQCDIAFQYTIYGDISSSIYIFQN